MHLKLEQQKIIVQAVVLYIPPENEIEWIMCSVKKKRKYPIVVHAGVCGCERRKSKREDFFVRVRQRKKNQERILVDRRINK